MQNSPYMSGYQKKYCEYCFFSKKKGGMGDVESGVYEFHEFCFKNLFEPQDIEMESN